MSGQVDHENDVTQHELVDLAATISETSDQGGQEALATPPGGADLVAHLIEQHRLRVDMHRAEKALTLRVKAVCRRFCGGDKAAAEVLYKAVVKGKGAHEHAAACAAWVAPLLAARGTLEAPRKAAEKAMVRLAMQLPVWSWAVEQRGFGALGLAQIVGASGDLANYANPAKLWKRLGLAVMDGVRQGGLSKNASAEEWIRHGYNRERRSLVYVIGDSAMKAGGPLRAVYDEYKARKKAELEALGLKVVPAAKISKKNADAYFAEGHLHKMALRYATKRLIRDLWRAWLKANMLMSPEQQLPTAAPAGDEPGTGP